MKTIGGILFIFLMLCTSCSENDNGFLDNDNRAEFFKPVDPRTEVSRFSRELQINGENFEGDMPIATNFDGSFVTGLSASASITSDNILFLPITFGIEDDVIQALVHIKNADNYWQLPVTPINNSTNLQIGIPGHVLNGTFAVDYVLIKSDGASSQLLETQVQIVSPETQCSGSNYPTITGNDGLTVKTYTLPNIGTGNLTITYNTFTIPDRVDVRYNDQWVASTGNLLSNGEAPPVKDCQLVSSGDGFIGSASSFTIPFDTSISDKLDVYVSGCLNNGTQWTVTVSCPQTSQQNALWYEELPDCPCTFDEVIEGEKTENPIGEWKKGLIYQQTTDTYHYGAEDEARWIPDEEGSGQQCTYDKEGNLITSGIAAGSPDLISPRNLLEAIFIHKEIDVKPWQANNDKTLPCTSYLKLWPANQGDCIPSMSNTVSDFSHMLQLVGNMSCEEVTVLLKIGASRNPLIPNELKQYLSGQNTAPPSNLKELLEAYRSGLLCDDFETDLECQVVKRAISNLAS